MSDTPRKTGFQTRLLAALAAREMSQAGLARELSVSVWEIIGLAMGEAEPAGADINKISAALNVSSAWLAFGDGQMDVAVTTVNSPTANCAFCEIDPADCADAGRCRFPAAASQQPYTRHRAARREISDLIAMLRRLDIETIAALDDDALCRLHAWMTAPLLMIEHQIWMRRHQPASTR